MMIETINNMMIELLCIHGTGRDGEKGESTKGRYGGKKASG